MKNCLVFYSSVNSKGKHDATGAFEPEAKAFAKLHEIPDKQVVPIACERMTKAERRKTVMSFLTHYVGAHLDGVVFFCHGWVDGFQMGFDRSRVTTLAEMIMLCTNSEPVISLYACSTAENDEKDTFTKEVGIGTDGGFADMLRDALCRQGLSRGWVDAHKTQGHATMNPMGVRFRMADVEDRLLGGVGGDWIVCPGSSVWKRWKKNLRPKGSKTFRFEYPFMSTSEIKSYLEKAA